MSSSGKDVVRTAVLSAWAMATLVLFFAVIFLVSEMIRRGQDPLEVSALDPPKRAARTTSDAPRVTKDVQIYFVNADGTGLAPETRSIAFGDDTVENCRQALLALIEGPREGLLPTVSSTADIRAMYLLPNGELVIDFSRALEGGMADAKSAWAETMMVRSIVASLAQPGLRGGAEQSVRSVRFTIEGAPPQDAFPAHVDLSEPVAPNSDWFRVAAGANADA